MQPDNDLEGGHFAIIAVLAIVSIIASKVLVKLAKKMQEYIVCCSFLSIKYRKKPQILPL